MSGIKISSNTLLNAAVSSKVVLSSFKTQNATAVYGNKGSNSHALLLQRVH
jgi:hypothetical protein